MRLNPQDGIAMSISRFPAYLRLAGTPIAPDAIPAAPRREPEIDTRTGVATRQALLERLEAMGELAPNAPLSFVVVKVAGLSPAHGEATLQAIAARIRELTRGTDVVGRLTGTTFGIALQGTGVTAAGAVAARLTHHLNRLSTISPSVCVTVTAATGTGVNADTLPVAAMDSHEPCCG